MRWGDEPLISLEIPDTENKGCLYRVASVVEAPPLAFSGASSSIAAPSVYPVGHEAPPYEELVIFQVLLHFTRIRVGPLRADGT